jgi:hypothetical protein
MDTMFDQIIDLTPHQCSFIKERYRFLLREYRRRCRIYSILFYILRITMTVGSLAVPALLSIQSAANPADRMYWITWSISLAVTTANGLTTLFKLDKRFFLLHGVAERLRTEAWQYLTLSGRYSGHHGLKNGETPTHKNQYVYYCSQIEKIRMKHIDDEFIRQADVVSGQPASSNTTTQNSDSTSTITARGDRIQNSALVPTPLEPAIDYDRRHRRQSISTIGSDETIVQMETTNRAPPASSEERTHSVSVSDEGGEAVSETGNQEQSVLPRTSTVRRIRSVRVGTAIQSGEIQQQQSNPGST